MSDEALYGLDAETVDWLHQLRDTTRGVRMRQGETQRQPAPGFHQVEKYLALTTSAISAATVADTTLATLASDINSSAQSLTVSSTASMPTGRMFVLSIGFEKILVTAIVSSTVINAVRGYDSTTAAGHSNGAALSNRQTTLGSGSVLLSRALRIPSSAYITDETHYQRMTAYNPGGESIAAGIYVSLSREPHSGLLLAENAWTPALPAGTGSGSLQCGCPCTSAPGPYCFTLAGLTDGNVQFPGVCESLNRDWTLSGGGCSFSETIDTGCVDNNLVRATMIFQGGSVCRWVLEFYSVNYGNLIARYAVSVAASLAWDCLTDLVFDLVSVNTNSGDYCYFCAGWPATITVSPCPGAALPTIDFSDVDVCADGTTLVITGTNFTSPASSNTVTLTDSGDVDVPCTVDSGTTTSLSLTLTSPPIGNLGELTATVSNANGTSDEVQVATVIDCGGITVAFLGSLATGAEETSLTFPLEDVEGLLVVDLGVLALGLTPTVEFDGDAMDLDSSVPVGGSDTATQYRYSLAVSGPVSGDLVVTLASAKWMGVLVHMVTGLADDALDQVGTSAGTSSNPTTNSITTTTAAEIIIATALVRRDGKTIDSADWTNSFSGMFFDPFMGICDTADEHEMVAAYRIVGETGSYSTQVSNIYTTVPNKWATIIGSYS